MVSPSTNETRAPAAQKRKRWKRTCLECGDSFEAGRPDADFCGQSHRLAYHNRRLQRGAIMYDLFMPMRFERDAAKAQDVWTKLCRFAAECKAEDDAEREGRQSWKSLQQTLAEHQYLAGKVGRI